MIREWILVLPGALDNHMVQLIPDSNQKNNNMKIDTLSCIQCLLTGHHPTEFHPHDATLVPCFISAASNTHKISSEALVMLKVFVKVLSLLEMKLEMHLIIFVLIRLKTLPWK